jgi:hypothetical protein
MDDAGRIVHGAIGIDGDGEALFTETHPDAVGKARTHKEHLLAGLYPEPRVSNVYNRPELHTVTTTLHFLPLRLINSC